MHRQDAASVAAEAGLAAGSRIGRYVIVDRLGEGGMGVVYSAFDPELNRQVAIKLLQASAGGSTSSATDGQTRLLREAQALARLAHPNVVAVHDAGSIGQSIFVAMEKVDGVTLRDWQKDPSRTWRELAEIYLAAGTGLAAAHRAGLVHRDFKPDNVLVGKDGRARVMDFGLARANNLPELRETRGEESSLEEVGPLLTPLTRVGLVMGTPAYMAPEQYRGASDARSDQFAFGVSLFEALYGERPFNARSKDPVERWRRKELKPKLPHPRALARLIDRAMALEAKDRFASMDELLAALARDPHRTVKRVALAASAALAIAAVAGAVQLNESRQLARCQAAVTLLDGVWDAGRRGALEASFTATGRRHAAEVLAHTLPALDVYAADWTRTHREACEATRVHRIQSEEVMTQRFGCLEQRRRELGSLVGLLSAVDAKMLDRAVQAVHALTPVSGCNDVAKLSNRWKLPSDPVVATAIEAARAKLPEVKVQVDAARYADALSAASALALSPEAAQWAPLRAEALLHLGAAQEKLGKFEEARASLRAAILAADRARDDELRARAAARLVFIAYAVADSKLGSASVEEARAILERLGGHDEIEGALLNSQAALHVQAGELQRGADLYREALRLRQKALPPGHPDVAMTLSNLGVILGLLGQTDEALSLLEQALELRVKTLGESHPSVGDTLANVGTVLQKRGRHKDALERYRRALALTLPVLGPEHPRVLSNSFNYGYSLHEAGEYPEAHAVLTRTLQAQQKATGEHPDLALTLHLLGRATDSIGDRDGAIAILERGLQLAQRLLGSDHPDIASHQLALGQLLRERGQLDRALPLIRAAVAHRKKDGAGEALEQATALCELGRALVAKGAAGEAGKAFEEARALAEQSRLEDHPELADVQEALAEWQLARGKRADALSLFTRAAQLRESLFGPEHSETAAARLGIARVHLAEGSPGEALTQLRAAAVGTARASGRFEVWAEVSFALAEALAAQGGDAAAITEAATRAEELYRRGGDKAGAAQVAGWRARRR